MRRFPLSVLVVLLCTRFPFAKPGISSLKLLPLVLASSFFSGNLLASRAEPVYKGSGNVLTIAAESQITYGFYVFSKTSDGSSGLSRVFLCLDDGTITLRCNVFDKSRLTLKSFPLFLEKTLKEPSFTLEKETYRVLPYGETWFTRRPFVAASTSLMAYAVKLSNHRPFVAASTSLMAYAVKLSNRRPFVAASTSASADAEDLTTSGDCSNANFALKYNSQELDKESQFYYFNARHYDPELARFVTADVVVDGEDTAFGWNRYMYVHGNPIMYKDPTGHFLDKAINFGLEVGKQVVDGLSEGKSLSKAVKDVNLKEAAKEASGLNDVKTLTNKESSTSEKIKSAISLIPGAKTIKKPGKIGKSISKLVEGGEAKKKLKPKNIFVTGTKEDAKRLFRKEAGDEKLKLMRNTHGNKNKVVGVQTKSNRVSYRPKKNDKQGTLANVEIAKPEEGVRENIHFKNK